LTIAVVVALVELSLKLELQGGGVGGLGVEACVRIDEVVVVAVAVDLSCQEPAECPVAVGAKPIDPLLVFAAWSSH